MEFESVQSIVDFVQRSLPPSRRNGLVHGLNVDANSNLVFDLAAIRELRQLPIFRGRLTTTSRQLAYICAVTYRRYFRNEPIFLQEQLEAGSKIDPDWPEAIYVFKHSGTTVKKL